MSPQSSSERCNWVKGKDAPAVSTPAIIGWCCSELLALKKQRILCVKPWYRRSVERRDSVKHNSRGINLPSDVIPSGIPKVRNCPYLHS